VPVAVEVGVDRASIDASAGRVGLVGETIAVGTVDLDQRSLVGVHARVVAIPVAVEVAHQR
jgi:hypothetical protein